MKRRSLFGILLGAVGAKAQQEDRVFPYALIPSHPMADMSFNPGATVQVEGRLLRWLSDGKPLNGQCPTCGTMAPAYRPDKRFCADTMPSTCGPEQHLAHCVRCNAAFFQDEERKP